MKRTIKSDLQAKLESEGWELLKNYSIADNDLSSCLPEASSIFKDSSRPTQYELLNDFERIYGVGNVMLEQGYDTNGEALNKKHVRAVYIKKILKK